MSETADALAMAGKAERCLERRDEYPGSGEQEAMAAIAWALLALLEQLSNGVVWTRSGDVWTRSGDVL